MNRSTKARDLAKIHGRRAMTFIDRVEDKPFPSIDQRSARNECVLPHSDETGVEATMQEIKVHWAPHVSEDDHGDIW